MPVEPCSIVFTRPYTGMILDILGGKRGATVLRWIRQRPRYCRQRVHYVAIDMSPNSARPSALHCPRRR